LDPQTTTRRSEHKRFMGEMDGHYARTRPCDSNPTHAAERMPDMHWQALALHPPNVSIPRRTVKTRSWPIACLDRERAAAGLD
jgi:hypothetical protein